MYMEIHNAITTFLRVLLNTLLLIFRGFIHLGGILLIGFCYIIPVSLFSFLVIYLHLKIFLSFALCVIVVVIREISVSFILYYIHFLVVSEHVVHIFTTWFIILLYYNYGLKCGVYKSV